MTNISIEEIGEGAFQFDAKLRALEDNLSMIPLASAEAMQALEKYFDSNWASGVEDTEETDIRWPDHSPLFNTGALKGSLTDSGSDAAIRSIDADGFTFGTSISYAHFLEYGTTKMDPKHFFPSARAVRAIVGYSMRKFLLRGTGLEVQDTAGGGEGL